MNHLLPSQGAQLGGGVGGWVSPPAADRVLTAEGQQAGVGDWGLTQVQHLEHSEVFRQEPQAGVSKLWGTRFLASAGPGEGTLRLGRSGRGWDLSEATPSFQHTALRPEFRSSFSPGRRPGKGLYQSRNLGSET